MQAPQNFASAHKALARGTNCSNRAAVYGIFQNTGAFLEDFRAEFLANARALHKETGSYAKNLHRSVRDMLAEMRQNREDVTNGTREVLKDYREDLHAVVAGAMREVEQELLKVSRLRHQAAYELALVRAGEHGVLRKNGRQQLKELANDRRKTGRALHSELCGFKADLADQVAQTRRQFRQELGFDEPARIKTKAKRARPGQPQNREEEPQKESTPRKAKTRGKNARAL